MKESERGKEVSLKKIFHNFSHLYNDKAPCKSFSGGVWLPGGKEKKKKNLHDI